MNSIGRAATVVACSAIAILGATCFAAAFSPLNKARLTATRSDQDVNRTIKTDRLGISDPALAVARSSKADGRQKPAARPAAPSPENSKVARNRGATRSATDDVTSGIGLTEGEPSTQVSGQPNAPHDNDNPQPVVKPVTRTNETATNVNVEPEAPKPASRGIWFYSKGSIERAQRRASYLWDVLTSTK